jgi:hypothetical protein
LISGRRLIASEMTTEEKRPSDCDTFGIKVVSLRTHKTDRLPDRHTRQTRPDQTRPDEMHTHTHSARGSVDLDNRSHCGVVDGEIQDVEAQPGTREEVTVDEVEAGGKAACRVQLNTHHLRAANDKIVVALVDVSVGDGDTHNGCGLDRERGVVDVDVEKLGGWAAGAGEVEALGGLVVCEAVGNEGLCDGWSHDTCDVDGLDCEDVEEEGLGDDGAAARDAEDVALRGDAEEQ